MPQERVREWLEAAFLLVFLASAVCWSLSAVWSTRGDMTKANRYNSWGAALMALGLSLQILWTYFWR